MRLVGGGAGNGNSPVYDEGCNCYQPQFVAGTAATTYEYNLANLTAGNTLVLTRGDGGAGRANTGSSYSMAGGQQTTLASGTQSITTLTAPGALSATPVGGSPIAQAPFIMNGTELRGNGGQNWSTPGTAGAALIWWY